MSSSDYLSNSDADYKENPADHIANSYSNYIEDPSDPKNIENSISNTINHITPGIDTVPTKDNLVIAQRIDETNEHISKIAEKLDIIIDLLGQIKDNGSR